MSEPITPAGCAACNDTRYVEGSGTYSVKPARYECWSCQHPFADPMQLVREWKESQ